MVILKVTRKVTMVIGFSKKLHCLEGNLLLQTNSPIEIRTIEPGCTYLVSIETLTTSLSPDVPPIASD